MNEFIVICISRDLRVRNNGIETVRFWIRDVVTMCDVSDRSSVSYSLLFHIPLNKIDLARFQIMIEKS